MLSFAEVIVELFTQSLRFLLRWVWVDWAGFDWVQIREWSIEDLAGCCPDRTGACVFRFFVSGKGYYFG